MNLNNDNLAPKQLNMVIEKNLHWLLLLGGVVVLGIALSVIPDDAKATRAPATELSALPIVKTSAPAETNIKQAKIPSEPEVPGIWQTAKVKQGDNLSLLFSRNGLSPQELYKLTVDKTAAKQLKKIFPGDEIKLRIDGETLTELNYEFGLGLNLHMLREGDTFITNIIERPLEHRRAQATGTIKDSLFLSAQSAGLSDKLTMELAAIFGWDVDFALDIRKGDSYSVIYEEVFLDDEKVRDGKIIAASFTNRGKSYQAIRFTDSDGRTEYYSPDGRSMRKAFLRTPVELARISSRFNLRRKHPVLNTIRAHKGVDYAASTGTPIRATGDGKIVHRGRKGGYGRTIIIQHGSSYNTLYAHMSKYANSLRNGSRVKQGQIIGYVGSSGLATGPHLHYEFRLNGAVRNPLTVKLPDAKPLPKKHMDDFKIHAAPLLASLDQITTPLNLASAN